MSTTNDQRPANLKRGQKLNHEIDNPCMKEHNLSLKCLNDNNYDHESCKLYFINYKACQQFWKNIKADRKSKGLPPLPPIEERQTVKNEYLNARNKTKNIS